GGLANEKCWRNTLRAIGSVVQNAHLQRDLLGIVGTTVIKEIEKRSGAANPGSGKTREGITKRGRRTRYCNQTGFRRAWGSVIKLSKIIRSDQRRPTGQRVTQINQLVW